MKTGKENIDRVPTIKRGKKTGGRKAGTPNKKTVMLSTLGIFKYQDLTEKLITSWIELLNSQDKTMKLTALKELSKLVFDSKSTFTNKIKILTGEPEEKATDKEPIEIKITYV